MLELLDFLRVMLGFACLALALLPLWLMVHTFRYKCWVTIDGKRYFYYRPSDKDKY